MTKQHETLKACFDSACRLLNMKEVENTGAPRYQITLDGFTIEAEYIQPEVFIYLYESDKQNDKKFWFSTEFKWAEEYTATFIPWKKPSKSVTERVRFIYDQLTTGIEFAIRRIRDNENSIIPVLGRKGN
jgi:DUF1680 family protein